MRNGITYVTSAKEQHITTSGLGADEQDEGCIRSQRLYGGSPGLQRRAKPMRTFVASLRAIPTIHSHPSLPLSPLPPPHPPLPPSLPPSFPPLPPQPYATLPPSFPALPPFLPQSGPLPCSSSLPMQIPPQQRVFNAPSLGFGALTCLLPSSSPSSAPSSPFTPPTVHRSPIRCDACGAFVSLYCAVQPATGAEMQGML